MCIVESTTFILPDGNTTTRQGLKPCSESRNGQPCKFETYEDHGEVRLRDYRPESSPQKSPVSPFANGSRKKEGRSSANSQKREKLPRSYFTRGAEAFFGKGRERTEKHYKKVYHKGKMNESQGLYNTTTFYHPRTSRRYSYSGEAIDDSVFKGPGIPPVSSQAGPSKVFSPPNIQSPLSPPRSPRSPIIQQSGTAVYHHSPPPSSPSHLAPSYRVGKGPRAAETKLEGTYKHKPVIINNSRNKDEQRNRPYEGQHQPSAKGGKYVMSGALNFVQPGPTAPTTPPITPERPDNEYQERGASRERERAKTKAYYENLKKEENLDRQEEREQARYKFREEERERRRKERRRQEELEEARQSRASSISYDYERGEREREEFEALSEQERRRQKREGKRPTHRASPAPSDPFPVGHVPSAERHYTTKGHHKHSHSMPNNHTRSDDLAATREQMARERAEAEAWERQEAAEEAARYERARAKAQYDAEMGYRFRPSPTTPAAPRYPETPDQSPYDKLDHISSRRNSRRPSTADTLYTSTKPYDLRTPYSPSRTPLSAGAATPSPRSPYLQQQQQQHHRYHYPHTPYDPYAAYRRSPLYSPGAYPHQPYQQRVPSGSDALRERGAQVLAAAAAEESRSRAEFGGHAGLSPGLERLKIGQGTSYGGGAGDGSYGGYANAYGATGFGGTSGGIRRRGTISGDSRGWYQREQRGRGYRY